MALDLTILYRGPLSSCNYGCWYCPFAKRRETAAELAADEAALARFVRWATEQTNRQLAVLFTPWGEALIHSWYPEALARLSALSHVRRVAIQTNLSCDLGWVDACDRTRLALWTTYHPGETDRAGFLGQCRRLDGFRVRYSVGVVGLKEHAAEVEALRRELPPDVYLWVNAYKDRPNYYEAADVARLTAIDPLFPINNQRHPSRGRACQAGHTVIAVDGAGTIRRCHFIAEPLGNIFQPDFEQVLLPRTCTNETCGCHIGYVHLNHLGLYEVFGDGVLERIPRAYASETPQPQSTEPDDADLPIQRREVAQVLEHRGER